MKGLFLVLCILVVFALPVVAAPDMVCAGGVCLGGTCAGGVCTLEVPVVAIIQPASHPVVATVGRSVGAVGKVAAVPVRVVKAVAEKKPVRTAVGKAVKAKPVRKALAVAGRCICHRRHSE